jgi:hypothetical protein
MKKKSLLLLTGLIALLFSFPSCNAPNKSDLEKILSPGALPYLKASKLIQVSSYDTTGENNDKISIPADKSATILDVPGPGVITRIWLTIDSRDTYFLRRILIRMYWDDEDDPSVEVPIGDFFGCGFKYQQYTTPFLSMSNGGYTCFFPMPFESNARIEIVNETGQEIYGLYYQVDYQKLEGYLARDIGYFHTYWHRDIRTGYDSNYTILETSGKGHVVGVNMNIQSYDGSLSYLEGDEKVFVDKEKIPSIQGTGTEDYFSGGWYFSKGTFTGPYNGLVLKDDSLGRISAYRFHILDPIPFKKFIKFTIEHGHKNSEIADYSSTVYWYQTEPHQKMPPVQKASLRIPLRVVTPNSILEAEKLKFSLGNIGSKVMDMSEYGPEWSGHKQLLIEARDREAFSLPILNLQDIGYDVNIYYTKGPNYGNIGIYNGDKKVGEIDGYNPAIIPGGKVTLLNLPNPYSRISLEFVVEGRDPASSGYNIGLDGISLVPVRKWITDWYISGPFPNPRGIKNVRAGLDSVYPPEKEIKYESGNPEEPGKPSGWQYVKVPVNGYISLSGYVKPNEMVVCYALTYIYSPEERVVPLFIGSDDGMKVFFNDKQIYRYLGIRVAVPDQAEIFLRVKKGWNKLLLKIENNFGGYAFYARLIDKDNILVISTDRKLPPKGMK